MNARQPDKVIDLGPRCDSWRLIGPGEGGPAALPTISPHDPNVAVERGVMSGCYITTDGGQSWRMFNLGSGVCAFAFDPSRPAMLYAGTVALWRSEDLGRTWRMLLPDPARNTREYLDGDHSHLTFSTDDSVYPVAGHHVAIQAIAIDPADPHRILIAFGPLPARNQAAVLLASEDDGRTWKRAGEFGQEKVFSIHIPPPNAADRRVRVVAETGVYVADGALWRHLPAPNGGTILSAAVGTVRNSGATALYAVSGSPGGEARLFVSLDGGSKWSVTGRLPVDGDVPVSVGCAAMDADHAFVGFRASAPSGEPAAVERRPPLKACPRGGRHSLVRHRTGEGGTAAACTGIVRTSDAGQTWAVVHVESEREAVNMTGGWYERWPDRSPHAALDAPQELAVAPRHPDVCLATDLWRTYGTADAGAHWRQLYTTEVSPGRWSTRGLDMTNAYSIHFDPFDVRRLLVACTNIGVLQSDDGERAWAITNGGLPASWRRAAYGFVHDPAVNGRVWGALASVHDLPRPKMWRHRDPATYEGGVAVSDDGGSTWQTSNDGMVPAAVTHVLLDPRTPAGSRTLYACAFGRGVYKSADDGRSWALKNNGIEGRQPFAWRMVQSAEGTLYLVAARRSEDGRIGDDGDGALYASADGAETWRRLPLPSGCNGPAGLAVAPGDVQRLYLAAWGRYRAGGDLGGGVFLSTDGGRTWQCVFDECQHVYDVTIDPRNAHVLYVCTFDSGAWRSEDSGLTWMRLKGYTFKWGHRVIPDPLDAEKVYITTYGGGLWHGPARGERRDLA